MPIDTCEGGAERIPSSSQVRPRRDVISVNELGRPLRIEIISSEHAQRRGREGEAQYSLLAIKLMGGIFSNPLT